MKNTLKISSKGQITLPGAARKRLGLTTGDQLKLVKISDSSLTLEKKKLFKDYKGKFKDVFPEDAARAVRELRDKE